MEFFERDEAKYRPPPKRHRNYAFVNPLFWITWAACSALIFSIIVDVIHVPPKGSRWRIPILDDTGQPLPPEPPPGSVSRANAGWSDKLGRKLLGIK